MLKRFAIDTLIDPTSVSTWTRSWSARRDTLATAPTSRLFGLDLVCATRAHAAEEIVAMAAAGERATIQFVNAHCVNRARRDAAYRRTLARSDLLLPDGSGIAIAARLAGVPLGDNLNGTDLFPDICRNAAQRGQSIFLLGGRPGIAARAAQTMRTRQPGLHIAGTYHGFWRADEEEMLIDEINASGATIVMVGLGVPLQEKWIDRVRPCLAAPIVMGVGGLFDYYSGAIPRAPAALRAIGCEWAWRLLQEPRRMAGRYLLGNPLFLLGAVGEAWKTRAMAQRLSAGGKRLFDAAASIAALLIALPLFLAVAAAIKLEDGGPVFFRQTRIGARGRPFRMWKFRSMVIDAEARLAAIRAQSERDGTCFKMKRDPRITRVGALLRRLSLDELPQLFNIAAGDMSVVGPRPALPGEVLRYAPEQRERLAGLPGLTCTWQVSGRADIPFEQQALLDIAYLRGRSFLQDLALIFRTIPAVLTARGAY
ncbi:MAG: WecB/TagA/CpsF family glycosyltransferase [Sphingopyxis sp.]|uniref:WecB/TagA/CpsF family glycosyltransferase n=1 Tax=Sphingopyxis sp. TaxID=1908224 RepID=UPI002ABAC495|nr:WecB/TagA/CpsF family glycosyltransferase [Sphingopyxis sp.]MDZ3830808.1 WecB/TagA/CpsF family glycosyltransferase [Sphingopyxis sp.]